MSSFVQLGPCRVFYEDPETYKWVLTHGLNYEKHLSEAIKLELGNSKGFLDIGCNVGFHTVLAKIAKGSDFPTVSVDANPENCRLLLQTIIENGFTNSMVLPVAASDKTGVVYGNNSWNTGLMNKRLNDDWRWLYPAIPLDIVQFGRMDTIKIDVEGFELSVLRGMKNQIACDAPTIFFEYNLHCMQIVGVDPLELLYFFDSIGYELTTLEYREGMRRSGFKSPDEIIEHIAKFGEICDIMAKPKKR